MVESTVMIHPNKGTSHYSSTSALLFNTGVQQHITNYGNHNSVLNRNYMIIAFPLFAFGLSHSLSGIYTRRGPPAHLRIHSLSDGVRHHDESSRAVSSAVVNFARSAFVGRRGAPCHRSIEGPPATSVVAGCLPAFAMGMVGWSRRPERRVCG